MAPRHIVMLLVISAMSGASFLFIKIGLRGYPPEWVVLGRVAVAAAATLPFGWAARRDLRAHWRELVVLGILNASLPFWFQAWGETELDSGLTGVLGAAAPLLTALLALGVDRTQRVRGLRLLGLVVGFAGVAVLLGARPSGEVLHAVAILGAAASFAAAALYAGIRLARLPAGATVFGSTAVGTLLAVPFAAAAPPDGAPGWGPSLAVASLALLGTALGPLLYFQLIREAGASIAILVTYLMPVGALIYGALLLGEPVTASAVAGLALILGGVGLGTGLVRR